MKLAALRSLADVIRLMLDKETHARRPIVAGVLVEALTSAFMLLGPIALKLAVDEMARPRFDAAKASVDIALFAVLWSASAISSIALLAYTGRIVHAVSNALLRRALHAQLPALASRASSDSGYVQGLLERLPYSLQVIIEGVLWKIVPVAIQLAVALVLIALLVPLRYAAILFAVLAAYFVFSHLSAEQYEKSAATTNEAAGALSAALGDVLANAPRVVYNGALAREIDYVGARAGARLDVDWRRSWLLTRAAACQYGIIALGMAAMFVLCVRDIAAGRITLGDFMLLQTYVLQFALPLGAYGFVLRQAGAALANVREALDIAPRPAPAAAIGA
ncbi:ABC transporter ATP-binding protein, partial [Burkholderia pseudomallei]